MSVYPLLVKFILLKFAAQKISCNIEKNFLKGFC